MCLLGGNASGKSTTLKTILGIVRPRRGRVVLAGEDVTRRSTSYRVRRGLAIVPENRRVFAPMTVLENLEMGAYVRGAGSAEDFERVYELVPAPVRAPEAALGDAVGGRAADAGHGPRADVPPAAAAMDEPSMGLAPILVEQSFEVIQQVHERASPILVVEQNANMSLSVADRGYVLQTGRVVLADTAAALLAHEGLRKAYLGR